MSGELVDTWEYETCGQATGWVTGADGVRRKTVAHAGSVFYLEDFKNNITVRGEWKSFSKCLACRAVAEKALQDALTRARSKNGGRLNETTKVVPAIEKEYGPAGSVFYVEMNLGDILRNLAETYNSLLENVKVPPSVWQPGGKSYVRDETAVLSGGLDQGHEELSEIPAMVGLGLAFVSDPDGAFEQLKTFAQEMSWQKAQSLAVEVARGAVFADEFEKGGKYALHATGRVGVVLAKAATTGGLLAVIREAPNTLKKRLDDIVALLTKLKSRLKNPSAELVARLETDLANKEFFDALRDKNELVDAWERTFDIFPANSKFITDIPTLERVSKLASEGVAFRTKLGNNWSEALDDILKNANDLKCSSCGNAGRIGRSSMDQYLDDVDYFVSNFNVGSGGKGETFFNWMRNTTNPTSGQLDELHQTIRDFAKRGIKESEIEGLGKQFPVGTKRYDLRRVGDKYTEYKNKDFVGSPLTAGSDDVDQFINGYLKNVKSMDDLEWKAGYDKLKSAWGSEANALTKMKGQWKSVFQNKADDIFEANPSLFNKLKLKDGTLVTDSELFGEFLEEVTETNKLFDFVKVE